MNNLHTLRKAAAAVPKLTNVPSQNQIARLTEKTGTTMKNRLLEYFGRKNPPAKTHSNVLANKQRAVEIVEGLKKIGFTGGKRKTRKSKQRRRRMTRRRR